jgi:hypothetical protein
MPGFNIGSDASSEASITVTTHRSHRWRITSLGEGLINKPTMLYAKSIQLPGFSIEEEIVVGASIKYKFAKTVNWEDVSLSFYDVMGMIGDMRTWQDKVYTNGEGINSANDYKKTSSFILTDGVGESTGPTFTLKNSWPKSISHSELSYDNSEIKLINMILSYDWAEIEAPSQPQ